MSFQTTIQSFVNAKDESAIGYYMIHLERAKERIQVISELEEKIQTKLPLFKAADGKELLSQGHPYLCAHSTDMTERCAGDVGCTVSHTWVCRDALQKNLDYAVVFEDDCVLNQSLETVLAYMEVCRMYFEATGEKWDLFLLGNNAHLDFEFKTPFLAKVRDFYGTHAVIMSRKFMETLLEIFDEAHSRGRVHSADGLYSTVLKSRGLVAYGCSQSEHFFEQKKGMYSYIVEKVRS